MNLRRRSLGSLLLALALGTSAHAGPWADCPSGKPLEQLFLHISPVRFVDGDPLSKDADEEPVRALWYDFKQFELTPDTGPFTIRLRLLVDPSTTPGSRYRHVAQIVRMAEGEAMGEYHYERPPEHAFTPDTPRAGSSWSNPREGILWEHSFELSMPEPPAEAAPGDLVPVEAEVGPVPAGADGDFTFVVHSGPGGGLPADRAYATICRK